MQIYLLYPRRNVVCLFYCLVFFLRARIKNRQCHDPAIQKVERACVLGVENVNIGINDICFWLVVKLQFTQACYSNLY